MLQIYFLLLKFKEYENDIKRAECGKGKYSRL
jgi:hypothetical protein